jgi:hypothetical protein
MVEVGRVIWFLVAAMAFRLFRSKQVVPLVLGAMLVILLGAVPAKAQCMLTAWMGGGYCYDWVNMFSGRTVRIYSSGGREVEARTPFGVMYGEWVAPGDAVLDAGNQLVCCYGQRSTGLQYGFCKVCG